MDPSSEIGRQGLAVRGCKVQPLARPKKHELQLLPMQSAQCVPCSSPGYLLSNSPQWALLGSLRQYGDYLHTQAMVDDQATAVCRIPTGHAWPARTPSLRTRCWPPAAPLYRSAMTLEASWHNVRPQHKAIKAYASPAGLSSAVHCTACAHRPSHRGDQLQPGGR